MTIKLVVKSEKSDAGSAAKTFAFDELLVTLGSNPAASVPLNEAGIAHEQALIINENEQPLFINQNKGTILNGTALEQGLQHNLRTGDSIIIGSYQIVVVLLSRDASQNLDQNEAQTVLNQSALGAAVEPRQIVAAPSEPIEEKPEEKLDARSFKDILKGLRKEEDQYYFQITDHDDAKRRLPIDVDELVLGWNNEQNLFVSNQVAEIVDPQAVVRKDWSGITIYPNGAEAVFINNALLEAGTLLRNGDRVVFSRRIGENQTQTATLVFCEPAALVELNQILPQELLSNALEAGKSGEVEVEAQQPEQLPTAPEAESQPSKIAAKVSGNKVSFANKLLFGYFYPAEIGIMIFATILIGLLTFFLMVSL